MKKIDYNGRKLCQIQGRLFEESIDKVECSSLVFIRRFMNSKLSAKFDDFSFLVMALDSNDCFYEIENEYGKSSYGKIKYSSNEMFWIGYVYRALSIIYNLPSKKIFNLLNAKEIVKYYNIYHTFDIEQACEKIMESINYHIVDLEKDAYKLLKKLMIREKLENMIGENVKVYIENPVGMIHSNNKNLICPVNYGYIKEITGVDDEYQGVYVLGEEKEIYHCLGKVYAVLENDLEDKLIVTTKGQEYTTDEINKIVEFEEKLSKSKIIK